MNGDEYVSAMIDLKKFWKTQRFKSMILYQMIKFVWLTEKKHVIKKLPFTVPSWVPIFYWDHKALAFVRIYNTTMLLQEFFFFSFG